MIAFGKHTHLDEMFRTQLFEDVSVSFWKEESLNISPRNLEDVLASEVAKNIGLLSGQPLGMFNPESAEITSLPSIKR